MTWELVYTSVPEGLKPGARGFCTVARTKGIAEPLAAALENLSGYRRIAETETATTANPVAFSRLTGTIAGTPTTVLSRVADAGFDYTRRTNSIAHHWATTTDFPAAGPAAVLESPNFFVERWNDAPRELDRRTLPAPVDAPIRCESWAKATGDAGWAGVLAATLDANRPVYLIVRPEPNVGARVLRLFREALSLVPPEKRWKATFTTYFTQLPPEFRCQWKTVVVGTPEEKRARAAGGATVIDLTTGALPAAESAALPGSGRLIAAARETVAPKPKPAAAPSPTVNRAGALRPGEIPLRTSASGGVYGLQPLDESNAPKPSGSRKPLNYGRDAVLREDVPKKSTGFGVFVALVVVVALLLFGGIYWGVNSWQQNAVEEAPGAKEAEKKAQEEKEKTEQAAAQKAQEEERKRQEEAAQKAEEEKKRQEEAAQKAEEEERKRQAEAAQKAEEEEHKRQEEAAQKAEEERKNAEDALAADKQTVEDFLNACADAFSVVDLKKTETSYPLDGDFNAKLQAVREVCRKRDWTLSFEIVPWNDALKINGDARIALPNEELSEEENNKEAIVAFDTTFVGQDNVEEQNKFSVLLRRNELKFEFNKTGVRDVCSNVTLLCVVEGREFDGELKSRPVQLVRPTSKKSLKTGDEPFTFNRTYDVGLRAAKEQFDVKIGEFREHLKNKYNLANRRQIDECKKRIKEIDEEIKKLDSTKQEEIKAENEQKSKLNERVYELESANKAFTQNIDQAQFQRIYIASDDVVFVETPRKVGESFIFGTPTGAELRFKEETTTVDANKKELKIFVSGDNKGAKDVEGEYFVYWPTNALIAKFDEFLNDVGNDATPVEIANKWETFKNGWRQTVEENAILLIRQPFKIEGRD